MCERIDGYIFEPVWSRFRFKLERELISLSFISVQRGLNVELLWAKDTTFDWYHRERPIISHTKLFPWDKASTFRRQSRGFCTHPQLTQSGEKKTHIQTSITKQQYKHTCCFLRSKISNFVFIAKMRTMALQLGIWIEHLCPHLTVTGFSEGAHSKADILIIVDVFYWRRCRAVFNWVLQKRRTCLFLGIKTNQSKLVHLSNDVESFI